MTIEKPTILIADDEEKTRRILKINLQDAYRVLLAQDGAEALANLEREKVHLVLTDVRMPGMDGIELLKQIKKSHPFLPVIIMTAFGAIENAVQAIKMGAHDYILKPIAIDELEVLLQKSLDFSRVMQENIQLKEKLKKYEGFQEIITLNPKMKALLETIKQVALTPATVLVEGESGTGKLLFAKAVHYYSSRADNAFVEINCGAIPHDLLESELFGHEKGAFTGAVKMKKGKFELAHQGTLFLDEIGELPKDLQVKLLHILENQKFTRVGGTQFLQTDARIVAATNRRLQDEVNENRFRQDLYYRLKVVYLQVPPLRERKEDIPLLVHHFLKKHENMSPTKVELADDIIQILQAYDWPGNVRELENIILQAMILAGKKPISRQTLPQEIIENSAQNLQKIPNTKQELQREKHKRTEKIISELEYQFLSNLLQKTKGNITRAAEFCGYDRRQIQNLINKHHINVENYK